MTETATMDREQYARGGLVSVSGMLEAIGVRFSSSDKPASAGVAANASTKDEPETTLDEIFERHDIGDVATACFQAAGMKTLEDVAKWLKRPRTDGPGEVARFNKINDLGLSENTETAVIGVLAMSLIELGVDMAEQLRKSPEPMRDLPASTRPGRKEKKPKAKKTVNYVMIRRYEVCDEEASEMLAKGEVPEPSEPYRHMNHLIANYHDHLVEAKIGLCWQRGLKQDKDGKLELGKCRKASDLSREFADFDFIITLNEQVWDQFKTAERLALLDHELCHAQVTVDEDDEVKRDERGRIVYRIKKHDLEEFRDVVDRHGCWKDDLTQFAEALMAGKQGSLLPRRRRVE